MKKFFNPLTLVFILTVLTISTCIIQCDKQGKSNELLNPSFNAEIAAFTSGIISAESTIRIVLANDHPMAGEPNTPVIENLFRFKPVIKGQAFWVDNRTIEFRPDENFKSGELYSARFFLSKVLTVDKESSVFDFEFQIVEQAFSVHIEGYQTVNENDMVWNKIKGVINTADYIDNEVLDEYFIAKQQNRKLSISWLPSSDRRSFEFEIDSIKRTESPGKVEISWDATKDFKKTKGSYITEIPSLSDYKVLDIKVVQQPEQYIQILLSDPVKKNLNLDGLIFLENNISLQFTVIGNLIKAFPEVRQSGKHVLTIQNGLKNIMGYELKQTYSSEVAFESLMPAVRTTGKGVILPSSKGLVFPFEAVNLSAVDVRIIKIYENNIGYFLQVNNLNGDYQLKRAGRLVYKNTVSLKYEPVDLGKWNRFYLDLAKLIEPDKGAIYRVEISFKRKYSLFPCNNTDEFEEETGTEEDYLTGMEEFSYWDSYEEYFDDYYEYDYDYDWDERENPCSDSYYTPDRWVARNILASDIGIIAKKGSDNTFLCAVTNLVTSEVLENAEITLYNFQQQPLVSGKSDKDGLARLVTQEKPYLLIAKHNEQRGYLRLDDGSSLSLGAFDVSGRIIQKAIKGFIYGERGVWRPGDTLFVSFILEDKQKMLPDNHPVVFELYNPKGKMVNRNTKTVGLNGFYSLAIPTSADAPTGNWNLKVKVGGSEFNKSIRIETIKPNRLKINFKFNSEKLSASKPQETGMISVAWLHGAVAARLHSVVSVKLSESTTEFTKFRDFQFSDPAKTFETNEQIIFDGYTDDFGLQKFAANIKPGNTAPGMLMANFTTRVFESSGDFSIDRISLPYSPYKEYVGIKIPEGDKRGMLLSDTTHSIEIAVVDEDGNPVTRSGIEVYIYKLGWRNWWESIDNELPNYIGNTFNKPIQTKNITVNNGRGKFGFRINYPDWGRYYIRVIDPVSQHSSGKILYVDWPGWAGRPLRDDPEAASMLTFNTDKNIYTIGETAEVIIPAGGAGRILFTLETGSRILSEQWLEVKGNEVRHKFTVTPEMAPNVYLSASLIQPHAYSENEMPMRLYGVIPIAVEDPQTKLFPEINVPEVLEPNKKFIVQVKEKNRNSMTYTLAIVEEGLLDLTRHKTPDPWSEFYSKEALGIKTWDLYDMVIGAYGGKLSSILGIGGDEELNTSETDDKANRFKPVVKYLGPFYLSKGSINKHSIEMPNYIGSVRVMVVAGQNSSYGSAEKTIPVKKPLMVLATLPRVLSPEETVKLPVTVFAMDNQIKDVEVSVRSNDLLIAAGPLTKSIHFNQSGEKVVEFDLKVSSLIGKAQVKVEAVSGKISSYYDIELDIRNPNPPVTTYLSDNVESKGVKDIGFKLPGISGTNSALLEVSVIPPIDAARRLNYLISYPHGCIEQVTSAVFPQLFLSDIMELDEKTGKEISQNIKTAINRLQYFQMGGGGFSYWPGQQSINSWGSSYAGHFLLEAEKKGYTLPAGLKNSWIKSQRQMARQWIPVTNSPISNQEDLEQAYRLFTLALAGEPELSAMNRLRETKSMSLQTKWRLAAAFALAGQLTVANNIVNGESTDIKEYNGLNSSYGSRERDWAMILETMILLNDNSNGIILARRIAEALSSDQWMSTQTAAYCLLAVSKFTKRTATGELAFTYALNNGKKINIVSSKSIVQIKLPLLQNAVTGKISIENKGQATIFTRVVMEGIPAAGTEEAFSNNLRIYLSYRDKNGKPLDITNLKQGMDFSSIVTIYNPSGFDYKDMTLQQLFPSCWEILNNRMAENETGNNLASALYQDIRDDRVYTYFNLRHGEEKTFTIQLNAAYLGKYYLPGTYSEAMYDNSIGAMIPGKWIQVSMYDE